MAISCCFGRGYSQRSKPSLKMAYLILLSLQVYCTSNFEERVETLTPPNWNSSSAKAMFDLKCHLTASKLHHRLGKCSHIFKWPRASPRTKTSNKICKPFECLATKDVPEENRYSPFGLYTIFGHNYM